MIDEKVKITNITEEHIQFSNGSRITFYHEPDCCEYNYADFEQIDDIARNTEFSWPLTFEYIDYSGFRFGNEPNKMFFVPCYSLQNGYYSDDVDIYLDKERVLNVICEEERDW